MGICNDNKSRRELEKGIISESSSKIESVNFNEDYIRQKKLENCPISISDEKLKIIREQMKKCICHTKSSDGEDITGFFCAIPFPNKYKKLPVLITTSKFLEKNEMSKEKIIFLNIDNNKLKLKIKIENNRKILIDEQYDITIIEIKKTDGLDINSFLDIDNQIFQTNINFVNQSIYIIYYEKEAKSDYSIGTIKHIIDRYKIEHNCQSNLGSLGNPIINLNNNRVIGIHLGEIKSKNYNFGKLLKDPIIKFNEKSNQYLNENNIENNDNNLNDEKDEITLIYKNEILKDKSWDDNKESDNFTNFVVDFQVNFFKANLSLNKIFGEKFVENNKTICKLIIQEKEYDICAVLPDRIKEIIKNDSDLIEIKLKGINKVTNMSYIFQGCQSLLYSPDIDKLNTINVTNMSHFFDGCTSLSYLPDIGKWKTDNVIDISYMFSLCLSMKHLPDIGNWNTNKVTNVEHIFSWCRGLTALPNISKWKTNNITDMNHMFNECYYINDLPDISIWNTKNVINMDSVFFGCKFLRALPDISKWNTEKVTSMITMFAYCAGLSKLPDISKWNTDNIGKTGFAMMFFKCKPTLNIPLKIKKYMYELKE